jgi:FG-GAP repeat
VDAASDAANLCLGGPSGLASAPAQTLRGLDVGGLAFGYKVANARDVNRDGFDDVAVSAVASNNQRGKVFIFLGGATGLNPTPAYTLLGSGDALTIPGDLNSAGKADLAVAAPAANAATGRVYIFNLKTQMVSGAPSKTLYGPGAGAHFGQSISH